MSSALTSVFSGFFTVLLGRWLSSADAYLAYRLAKVVTFSGDPRLLSNWFAQGVLRLLPGVEVVALISALIGAAMAMFTQGDPLAAIRSLVVSLPLVGVFAGVEIGVTSLLVKASDALATFVFHAFAGGSGYAGPVKSTFSALGTTQIPLLISLGLLAAYLVMGLMLWLEITLRSAAIYMLCAVLPFFAALAILRGARAILFRSLAFLGALLMLKDLIALGLGLSVAIGAEAGSAPSEIVMAVACLLVSALSPFALLRLFSIEFVSSRDLERGSHMVVRGASATSSYMAAYSQAASGFEEITEGLSFIPMAEGDPDFEGLSGFDSNAHMEGDGHGSW